MNPRDVATVPDGGDREDSELPSRLGHFEVVGRLGAGGMGLVFEGKDLVLGRRVALKLLHPGRVGNPIAPARLLREAQALAKLSHRNVVTVYEVGMAGDDPFVAMELVEGDTLAAWMKQPREWRTVLDVFIAAGHGLAAVHAIGLVHRDFKPSNVLFDKDGTPKLGDFGLVRPLEAPPEPAAVGAALHDDKLTQTGSVVGTPAYMPPEQRLGLGVDARADQFSFAKSLAEALGDKRPAKLQPILDRALADDPDERYPSMAPLLADLSRVRRGNRVRWISAGAALAVLAGLALAWGFGRAQSSGDPCARPTGRVAKVWSPQRRGSLQTHLVAIDPSLGAQRFMIATGVFDRGATRWMDQHVDACKSAHEGRQSSALLDRRMACLDRALQEIDASVGVLERATDRSTLDNAMNAAVALPALDDCADVKALMELVPRPTNPAQRAEADALGRVLAKIEVDRRVGGTKTEDVVDRANTAVMRARMLGDPATLASALRSLAKVQIDREAWDVALVTLREAITAASEAHDDRFAAEMYTDTLVTLVALRRYTEANTLLPAAEAAVARINSSVVIRTDFLDIKSSVVAANGDLDGARAVLKDALTQLTEAGAALPDSELRPQLIELLSHGATLYAAAGDFKGTADRLRDVIPLATEAYGADHPALVELHSNLGIALRHTGDNEEALTEFREAARIGEARLDPSPALAERLLAVGTTLSQMERYDEAAPYVERATAMARSTLPPGDPRLADFIGGLASLRLYTGAPEVALELLDEQIPLLLKRGGKADQKLAVAYYNRGEIWLEAHQCDKAVPDLANAATIFHDLGEADHVYGTLIAVADCQLAAAQPAEALVTTERILAAKDASDFWRASARFFHGKAVALAGDHGAGVAEVRAARADMVHLGMTGPITEVDQWLAQATKR